MTTAIRFLVAREQLAVMRQRLPEVDVAAVADRLERIRTALKRIAIIKRKATELDDAVQVGTSGIRTEAEYLHDDIRGALDEIEDALR